MQSSFTTRGKLIVPVLASLLALLAVGAAPTSAESRFSFTWGKAVQGSGKMVEVQRTVPAFDRIAVADGIQVVLQQGAQQKLTVKADDNIEPLIETRVEGNTLQLSIRRQTSLQTHNNMTVAIDYTQLASLKLSDGAQADLDKVKSATFQATAQDGSSLRLGEVTVNEFDLSVSDGGRASVRNARGATSQRYRVADGARLSVDNASGERVSLSVADGAHASVRAVDTKAIEISVADGAHADIAGVAVQQNFVLADAANVDALTLRGTTARVRAADGSSLKLGFVQTLDADVADGSSIRYSGEPTITRRVRDGASIRKI